MYKFEAWYVITQTIINRLKCPLSLYLEMFYLTVTFLNTYNTFKLWNLGQPSQRRNVLNSIHLQKQNRPQNLEASYSPTEKQERKAKANSVFIL